MGVAKGEEGEGAGEDDTDGDAEVVEDAGCDDVTDGSGNVEVDSDGDDTGVPAVECLMAERSIVNAKYGQTR